MGFIAGIGSKIRCEVGRWCWGRGGAVFCIGDEKTAAAALHGNVIVFRDGALQNAPCAVGRRPLVFPVIGGGKQLLFLLYAVLVDGNFDACGAVFGVFSLAHSFTTV